MELKNIQKKVNAYLRKKNIERAKKDREIAVSKMVKVIFAEKDIKQTIQFFEAIENLYNQKLDEKLKQSLDEVKEISNYKGIEL